MVLLFPPGLATAVVARQIGPKLAESRGQRIAAQGCAIVRGANKAVQPR